MFSRGCRPLRDWVIVTPKKQIFRSQAPFHSKLNLMSIRIYHNPRCSKSRQTLKLIEEAGVEPEIVLYLDSPPSTRELSGLLKKLGMEPKELMRRGEAVYKELGLAKKELTKKEAIQLLHDHPKLIERPIVVKGEQAVLGRPPENVLKLL